MKVIPAYVLIFFTAGSLTGSDRGHRNSVSIPVATTAHIVSIDLENRHFTVDTSGDGSARSGQKTISEPNDGANRSVHIARSGGMTGRGGIVVIVPGRWPRRNTTRSSPAASDQYTVIVTTATVLQDGSEDIKMTDFKIGEMISIHGVLTDKTLTASRIAKWL
jgi:hypothetical protein